MPRSLSSTESKLILHLEWERQPVVTIEQAADILGCSYNYARQILSRLARNRWLVPITSGKYELIPAERGEHAFPDTNPLFIGSTLVTPYYFSYATAAFFYGLSTQASAIVYIATTARKGRRVITVRDKEYRLVLQPPYKFFGAVDVDAYGSQVKMADLEKTLVDCLDRPAYAGDIPEVAAMLWHGKSQANWDHVAGYALRFQSQAPVQRLGYLADLLNLPLDAATKASLLAGVGRSTLYLGRTRQWGSGGEHNATWRIVDNIPRRELMAEIEVH
jgi:predicted transcriptional regulator of viral defense system